MAYSTLSYGSSGSEVKKLQTALNNAGYKLSVDGQFGQKTQAAVKDYQSKNSLSVDGIVGEKTWGSLSKSGSKTNAASVNKTSGTGGSSSVKAPTVSKRPKYSESKDVSAAEAALKEWEKNKPGDYDSKYSAEIDKILDGILNREKFSYNMNADPLYQQYKDTYTQAGKRAMMDTVGEASALSGGYANSYAVTAGSEAYQNYLNELDSLALELRDSAFSEYESEGQKMVEDVTLLRSLDGDDYDKYRDKLSDYYSDGNYLLDKLTSMSDAEYEKFLAQVDAWESDRDYNYNKYSDDVENQQFAEEMAFKQAEADRDQANADRTYALAKSKASSSGGSSKSSSSSSKKTKVDKYTIFPKTYKEFVDRSGYAGIFTESEFNSNSEYIKSYGTYKKYLERMFYRYG